MKKNVRVLLTVLVIIIAAVGGYFVYRGQDTHSSLTMFIDWLHRYMHLPKLRHKLYIHFLTAYSPLTVLI